MQSRMPIACRKLREGVSLPRTMVQQCEGGEATGSAGRQHEAPWAKVALGIAEQMQAVERVRALPPSNFLAGRRACRQESLSPVFRTQHHLGSCVGLAFE